MVRNTLFVVGFTRKPEKPAKTEPVRLSGTDMKQETIDIQAALEAGQKLPFAWVRSLSQVALGRTPLAVELEELLEARFFSRDREIRIFPGEDGLRAVALTGEPEDHVMEEEYLIENPQFGRSITVTRVLDWDEDGQAYIAATRLSGWKEGKADA